MTLQHLEAAPGAAFSFPSGAYTYRFFLSLCMLALVCLSVRFNHSGTGTFILVLVSYLFCADILHRAAWRDLSAFHFTFAAFASLSVTACFLYSLVDSFALRPLYGPLPSLYVETALLVAVCLWLLRRQTRRREQTKVFIKKLDDFLPKSARVCTGRTCRKLFAGELKKGDLILVKPGERIPCDGVLKKGKTAVDESLITGNMLPTSKTAGSRVYAGTLNKSDEIYVEVTDLLAASAIASILHTIKTSELHRGAKTAPSDKFSRFFLPVTLCACVAVYAAYLYFFGPQRWFFFLGAPLIVLGLGLPVAFIFSSAFAVFFCQAGAARRGITLQNTDALEELRRADAVFFDKTGTLTYGQLRVSSVSARTSAQKRRLLECAATAEQLVDGPFAEAINLYAEKHKIKVHKLLCFDVFPGLGVTAVSGKDKIMCGREKWFADQGIQTDARAAASASEAVVCVAKNGEYLGFLTLSDELRPGAKEVVSFLQKEGKEVILVSGDNESSVTSIARRTGIEQINFNVLPQTKAEIISNLRAMGKKVVMVGDGFNDIVALLRSDAGVVFSSGKNVYNNWVDIIIQREDLSAVSDLFKINKRLNNTVAGNVWLAFLLNGVMLAYLLAWAPAGLAWYWVPAGMGAAVLAVFINSARLLK